MKIAVIWNFNMKLRFKKNMCFIEIFEKIIDNVTEFMWCNFKACHMKKCSWENLREIRNYIKTEGINKVKDI